MIIKKINTSIAILLVMILLLFKTLRALKTLLDINNVAPIKIRSRRTNSILLLKITPLIRFNSNPSINIPHLKIDTINLVF